MSFLQTVALLLVLVGLATVVRRRLAFAFLGALGAALIIFTTGVGFLMIFDVINNKDAPFFLTSLLEWVLLVTALAFFAMCFLVYDVMSRLTIVKWPSGKIVIRPSVWVPPFTGATFFLLGATRWTQELTSAGLSTSHCAGNIGVKPILDLTKFKPAAAASSNIHQYDPERWLEAVKAATVQDLRPMIAAIGDFLQRAQFATVVVDSEQVDQTNLNALGFELQEVVSFVNESSG